MWFQWSRRISPLQPHSIVSSPGPFTNCLTGECLVPMYRKFSIPRKKSQVSKVANNFLVCFLTIPSPPQSLVQYWSSAAWKQPGWACRKCYQAHVWNDLFTKLWLVPTIFQSHLFQMWFLLSDLFFSFELSWESHFCIPCVKNKDSFVPWKNF